MRCVEVIEAIKTINKLYPLGDAIYHVREQYAEAHPELISWDLPEVKEFSDAIDVLVKEGVIDG